MTKENQEAPTSMLNRLKRVIGKLNPALKQKDEWPIRSKQASDPRYTSIFKEGTGRSLSEILFPEDES